MHIGTGYMLSQTTKQNRLDMLHHICLLVLRGELHTAPIGPNPTKILDLGTGTGIWAIDMGEQYPSAEVIGTDLSPIQPSWVPPNVSFLIDDAESEWEWPEGTFDMVHIRYLNGGISDWGALFAEAYRTLKPGGWIEVCEFEMDVASDDGTYVANSNLGKYYELTNEAARRAGRGFISTDTLTNGIEKAGFRNSTLRRIKIPLGSWPADPLQREIGECFLMVAETGFEALGMAFLTRNLGMDPGDVTKLVNSAKRELWSKRTHAYNIHYFLHAQKPLKPSV